MLEWYWCTSERSTWMKRTDQHHCSFWMLAGWSLIILFGEEKMFHRDNTLHERQDKEVGSLNKHIYISMDMRNCTWGNTIIRTSVCYIKLGEDKENWGSFRIIYLEVEYNRSVVLNKILELVHKESCTKECMRKCKEVSHSSVMNVGGKAMNRSWWCWFMFYTNSSFKGNCVCRLEKSKIKITTEKED